MWSRKLRHPARRQLDHPDAQRGNRSSTPLRIRLARATAGARYKKIESKSCSPSSCSPVAPGRVQRALELRDVEDRSDALVAERGPHGIEVRVRERLPVHRGRGDHGQADALGPHPPDLLDRPRRDRASSTWATPKRRSSPSLTDVGHEAVVGPRVGPLRVRGPRPAAAPTAGRSWGTAPRRRARTRRARRAGRRPAGTSRAPARRRTPARARRAGAAGGLRR